MSSLLNGPCGVYEATRRYLLIITIMASLWNWPYYVYEMMKSAAMASLWNWSSYVYEMMKSVAMANLLDWP